MLILHWTRLSLEDKVVQQAVVTVLNTIYEEDFFGFSCGSRQGRSQHDALEWLKAGVIEDGCKAAAIKGTPKGAVIAPLLANI